MCRDGSEWLVWNDHSRKHLPPPGLSRSEVIEATANGEDSLYLPGISAQAIEEEVRRSGVYVASAKNATVYKVKEFADPVGASDGVISRWIHIERTNGVFHGRPITEELYLRRLRKRIECCNE